ncbi:hypothetical protein Ntsu_40110 [Nocardia sp. IFM 10818]
MLECGQFETEHERGNLDEDAREVPAAWREVALPVRGLSPYRSPTPDQNAVELRDNLIAAERDSLYLALAAALAGPASAAPLPSRRAYCHSSRSRIAVVWRASSTSGSKRLSLRGFRHR